MKCQTTKCITWHFLVILSIGIAKVIVHDQSQDVSPLIIPRAIAQGVM